MFEVTQQLIEEPTQPTTLATPVAPEDIRAGDYLAAMNEFGQFVLRDCETDWQPGPRAPKLHVVRARLVESMPQVVRVLGVAVPFVLVEDRRGDTELITCRLAELARLPADLGRRAFRELDRKRAGEARKRRAAAAERRAKRDRPGAGAEGAD